eukprot:CAMPEP_0182419194 /NCGR_PEP_ID=MMETSP1167-20130531/3604_1 /TAXON_ID=2988 /ORGANISM="Mallomonas Sp, Strain CCMP3275" /LENGTH=429 /DNA_ID=CAMNT_0024593891 /DNA_START=563 /DNA_END=1852 /DNA_ORIENTATION=-
MKSSTLVETIEWKMGGTFIRSVVATEKPAVIVNSPSVYWPITKWDLLDMDILLNETMWQSQPLFILNHERERGGMLGSKHDQPSLVFNTPLQDFIRTALHPRQFMYWSGSLSLWEEGVGRRATGPSPAEGSWELFTLTETDVSVSEEVEESRAPLLRLMHPGLVLQTRYDTRHLFLAQLTGTSRVMLFPPDQELFLHPHIHRAYRQSQVTLEASEHSNCSDLSIWWTEILSTRPLEVSVSPGQLLYIPPFWHHRVESLTLSLSLLIHSKSAIEHEFAKVYWHPLPLGPFQNHTSLRARAVSTYLTLLLEKSAIAGSLQTHSLALYRTRFARLFPHDKLINTFSDRLVRSVCPVPDDVQYNASHLDLVNSRLEDFSSAASSAGDVLAKNNCSEKIKVTFLQDYIEELVRWAVGPHNTAIFLMRCIGENRL